MVIQDPKSEMYCHTVFLSGVSVVFVVVLEDDPGMSNRYNFIAALKGPQL